MAEIIYEMATNNFIRVSEEIYNSIVTRQCISIEDYHKFYSVKVR